MVRSNSLTNISKHYYLGDQDQAVTSSAYTLVSGGDGIPGLQRSEVAHATTGALGEKPVILILCFFKIFEVYYAFLVLILI